MGQLLQVFSIISGVYKCFYSYDNRIRPSPVVTASSQNGTVYENIDLIVLIVYFRVQPS